MPPLPPYIRFLPMRSPPRPDDCIPDVAVGIPLDDTSVIDGGSALVFMLDLSGEVYPDGGLVGGRESKNGGGGWMLGDRRQAGREL